MIYSPETAGHPDPRGGNRASGSLRTGISAAILLFRETNVKVRAQMEHMGGEVYKKYRIFGKSLQKITKKQAAEQVRQLAEAECG